MKSRNRWNRWRSGTYWWRWIAWTPPMRTQSGARVTPLSWLGWYVHLVTHRGPFRRLGIRFYAWTLFGVDTVGARSKKDHLEEQPNG